MLIALSIRVDCCTKFARSEHLGASALQSLSEVGRCKTFDASADGYGRAEGAAAAVLAPLSAGTAAFALLAGSAVNQDGRSGTLTAPNGPSQSALVSKALR